MRVPVPPTEIERDGGVIVTTATVCDVPFVPPVEVDPSVVVDEQLANVATRATAPTRNGTRVSGSPSPCIAQGEGGDRHRPLAPTQRLLFSRLARNGGRRGPRVDEPLVCRLDAQVQSF